MKGSKPMNYKQSLRLEILARLDTLNQLEKVITDTEALKEIGKQEKALREALRKLNP